MRRVTAAGAALACALLAGCTSSAGTAKSSAPSGPETVDGSSTPVATSPAPDPTTSSSAPLSPFESDPAVAGLRAWAAQAARTVNSGHYTSAALRGLGTSSLNKQLKPTLVTDVGLYYPGPVPFRPKSVRVVNASTRDIKACFVSTGFAQRRTTKRPAAKLTVIPVDSVMILRSGRWLLSRQLTVKNFSCTGTKVARPTWTG